MARRQPRPPRDPMPGLGETLAAGRAWLLQYMFDTKGVECPCCTQNVKVYPRTISAAEARALIAAWRVHRYAAFHAPSFAHISELGGSWAMLRRWHLIEEVAATKPTGGRGGIWRLTDVARQFIEEGLELPKHAKVFDNEFQGYGEIKVTIEDCLGHDFNLAERLTIPVSQI
jgi:hypothetical protein